jgi:dienelactone hydrolase
MGTLLFDLLTGNEELLDQGTGGLRFDIELLSARLIEVTSWLLRHPGAQEGGVGYFGSSTGAAAALTAAAELDGRIDAVVSRGGRPDLAGASLPNVTAPTLLIVGGFDEAVLALNETALAKLRCPKHLEVIAGATHLFEEPGALEQVAKVAAYWFRRHLRRHPCQNGGDGEAASTG